MTETIREDDEPIDLLALSYAFALDEIDPRIGRI